MTIVEFYDINSIENIVSTLLCAPEKVVFIGDNGDQLQAAKEDYLPVIKARGIATQLDYRVVNRNKLVSIVEALSDIAQQSEDCLFDLTGGDELYLVAAGMVFERYPEKVKLHRFNINYGKLSDCDADGNTLKTFPAQIGVEENIRIYGGRVIFEDEKPKTTHRWDFSKDFIEDVKKMWNVCRINTGLWNAVFTFSAKEVEIGNEDLHESVELPETLLESGGVYAIFKNLENCGIIKDFVMSEKGVSFRYKNLQVKECLSVAGRVLELYITVLALEMQGGKNKNAVFSDLLTGVYIDWDGVVNSGDDGVGNEIDVILMKGLKPIFISCKNGDMETHELYKLETVAERFGGKYAKKVLAVSDISKLNSKGESIVRRAEEMGITVIDVIKEENNNKLLSLIANL